jgi:hypothetical protein
LLGTPVDALQTQLLVNLCTCNIKSNMLNNPHVHHNLKSEVLELHERSTDLNRELS